MLCIGGATIDRTLKLAAPLSLATSNPVTGRRSFGGVARNVAENLARQGVSVELVTAVGHDEAGAALVSHLAASGVDTSGIVTIAGRSTADYVAVLTPDGDLAVGLADMAIFDALMLRRMAQIDDRLDRADWVFADCNLPAELLASLVERAVSRGCRLAVDAVSVAKSVRLPARLTGIALMILNRDEAVAVASRTGSCSTPEENAKAIHRAGASEVVLTLGADGALAIDREGLRRIRAVDAVPVDVTGAGDALIAGVLAARLRGSSLVEAVELGCRAAARAIGGHGAVPA